MTQQEKEQVIALAGIYQNAYLVNQLAQSGYCDSDRYQTALSSLFNLNPTSTLDVFGGLSKVSPGLQLLIQSLSKSAEIDLNLMRYSFATIAITTKLMKNSVALSEISDRLKRIKIFYPNLSSEVVNEKKDELSYSLSGIYSDVISPLTKKVRVMGKEHFLTNPLVQAQVRTALFACIRSAMLWYQLGGGRLQLIFGRKKIIKIAQELLNARPL